ncbi:hypothetical protein EAE96_009579 [Botrytis aclada]|nr:hypothetical protein EAE96_009579 [Botrytis aclada]
MTNPSALAKMTDRFLNRSTNPKRSALMKFSTPRPKLSARQLELWLNYFQNPSAPTSSNPPVSDQQKDGHHPQLLEEFKNYYMSNQVEITDHDTIIYILRTYSGMSVRSEYRLAAWLNV